MYNKKIVATIQYFINAQIQNTVSLFARVFWIFSLFEGDTWKSLDKCKWSSGLYPHAFSPWARICKPFKDPRNLFPAWRAGTIWLSWAGILKLFMGDRNRVEIGLSCTGPPGYIGGGIDSYESVPGLLISLNIRAMLSYRPAKLHMLADRFLVIDSWAP